MQYSPEERGIIWLCACTGFDYRERVSLLRAAKNPACLLKEDGNFFRKTVKRAETVVYKSDPSARVKELEEFLGTEEEKGRFAVTIASDNYPAELKHIHEPPLVLYGAGRRELLKKRKFCIVGSRTIPPWAERTGTAIAEAVSKRFAVVTGLAEGGDSAAIAGALKSGNLICVLPNGLDECYPASHASLKERIKERGLLLSECTPRETVKKYSFHARNRLLAGLCEGVLVLSAGERSGTLITANCALDYGRDVFALPHNVGCAQGEGCNGLIKKGAYLAEGAEDILSVYGMETAPEKEASLSAEEGRVLAVLRGEGELHAQEIATRAGLKVYEAAAVLSALEMKNLAVRAGGNRYSAL